MSCGLRKSWKILRMNCFPNFKKMNVCVSWLIFYPSSTDCVSKHDLISPSKGGGISPFPSPWVPATSSLLCGATSRSPCSFFEELLSPLQQLISPSMAI